MSNTIKEKHKARHTASSRLKERGRIASPESEKRQEIQEAQESNIKSDLALMCARAKEVGALAAAPILAQDVVLDERVRLKCWVPRCAHYDQNWMCPPHVIPFSEFKEILGKYSHAILIQVEIPVSHSELKEAYGDKDLSELYPTEDYQKKVKTPFKELYPILDKIESLAFSLGYHFVAGLAAGQCQICPKCAYPDPCPIPFRARPSMEALGIDVFETAQRAGLPIDFGVSGKPVCVGLVLVS
ncbi:DUF2284 domain-containing protein [Candidatus Hakubella thermalkaliphila]|nr:DUF2284 domain-containing protein [Candidatus Hakubella thermalkaliphila]